MSKKCSINDLLEPDKENELLQSFVRISLKCPDDDDDQEEKLSDDKRKTSSKEKTAKSVSFHRSKWSSKDSYQDNYKMLPRRYGKGKIDSELLKKRKPKESFNEFYTDKDRAAAVSAGSYDIKQSLKLKQKQDRTEALLVYEDVDSSSLLALAQNNIKIGNIEHAIQNISKALELNANDVNALVLRSKSYLLLGQPEKALQDAEAALKIDKNNIRAIYNKAESLYYLGQFEQSLMFFHRGLRARPELSIFRLGIQKTQEAIENTIGTNKNNMKKISHKKYNTNLKGSSNQNDEKSSNTSQKQIRNQINATSIATKTTKNVDLERRNTKKLLGKLYVDKEYLENLLKNPHLLKADTKTENISVYAKEAVDYLEKRKEFWRQQRPCTALQKYKNLPEELLKNLQKK